MIQIVLQLFLHILPCYGFNTSSVSIWKLYHCTSVNKNRVDFFYIICSKEHRTMLKFHQRTFEIIIIYIRIRTISDRQQFIINIRTAMFMCNFINLIFMISVGIRSASSTSILTAVVLPQPFSPTNITGLIYPVST